VEKRKDKGLARVLSVVLPLRCNHPRLGCSAPLAPGMPSYACCCFFSGLLGGIVVSCVFCVFEVVCVECEEVWKSTQKVRGLHKCVTDT
jgi:hypothetical protein